MNARIDDRLTRQSARGRSARLTLLSAFAMMLLGTSVAGAQYVAWPYGGPAYPAAAYAPWGHYESFHHCSTVAESALTGWSRYHRAWGQMNYLHALAASEYQRAYALALANRRVFLEPYVGARQAELDARAIRTAVRRRKRAERRMADYLEAQQLVPMIDATRGKLDWPAVLRKPEHRQHLAVISRCLALWIESDSLAPEYRSRLKWNLKELQTHLRRQQQFGKPTAALAQARSLLRQIDTLVFPRVPLAALPPVTNLAQAK